MDALLFFVASVTSGIWCAYFVEYLEKKETQREL
jgi:hypothetical protein